jgi:hypothetical protein
MSYREPAPDENTRYEAWDRTVREAEAYYQKAVDAEGERRQYFLRQAMNILDGVPDAHPDKASLVRKIRYMLY